MQRCSSTLPQPCVPCSSNSQDLLVAHGYQFYLSWLWLLRPVGVSLGVVEGVATLLLRERQEAQILRSLTESCCRSEICLGASLQVDGRLSSWCLLLLAQQFPEGEFQL